MADQISDAVLDAILAQDPKGRVACETLLTTGLVVVAGEFLPPPILIRLLASNRLKEFLVEISPATTTSPVVSKVSQATRPFGSCARIASKTASLIDRPSYPGDLQKPIRL